MKKLIKESIMKKKKRIFKIITKDKYTKKQEIYIIGDSYKSFEEQLLDFFSYKNKKWIYDDNIKGKGKCLGRKLKCDILKIYEAQDKFVSFGGLKWCIINHYDEEVKEHNKHVNNIDERCKYLKYIYFQKKSQKYLNNILNKYRIISNEENN